MANKLVMEGYIYQTSSGDYNSLWKDYAIAEKRSDGTLTITGKNVLGNIVHHCLGNLGNRGKITQSRYRITVEEVE